MFASFFVAWGEMSQCFSKAFLTPVSHISGGEWTPLKVIPFSFPRLFFILQLSFLMNRVTFTLELSSPMVCLILVLKEIQFGAIRAVCFLSVLME